MNTRPSATVREMALGLRAKTRMRRSQSRRPRSVSDRWLHQRGIRAASRSPLEIVEGAADVAWLSGRQSAAPRPSCIIIPRKGRRRGTCRTCRSVTSASPFLMLPAGAYATKSRSRIAQDVGLIRVFRHLDDAVAERHRLVAVFLEEESIHGGGELRHGLGFDDPHPFRVC